MKAKHKYLVYGTDREFWISEFDRELLDIAFIIGVIAIICYLFI